jgi:hypothetical protein
MGTLTRLSIAERAGHGEGFHVPERIRKNVRSVPENLTQRWLEMTGKQREAQ